MLKFEVIHTDDDSNLSLTLAICCAKVIRLSFRKKHLSLLLNRAQNI